VSVDRRAGSETDDPAVPAEGDDPSSRRRLTTVLGVAAVVLVLGIPFAVAGVALDSSASITDAETLGTNRLGAADLALELQTVEGGLAASGEGLLQAPNLAPGDRVTGQLVVSNVGDVPLIFDVSGESTDPLFADWMTLEAWIFDGTCSPDQSERGQAQPLRTDADAPVQLSGVGGRPVVEPGAAVTVCIGATLDLGTPNDAQGREAELTIVVNATHYVEGQP
jgi:hypothetical protein